MKDRFQLGASVDTISAELAQRHRMRELGYTRAPGPTMLATHVAKHNSGMVPVQPSTPVFSTYTSYASPPSTTPTPGGETDIAKAIQRQALEQLQRGEMRLTAAHALRAQELIDRRAEKQADREMQVALARIILSRREAPAALIGEEQHAYIIEGEAREV
jgi:hypothetical protein